MPVSTHGPSLLVPINPLVSPSKTIPNQRPEQLYQIALPPSAPHTRHSVSHNLEQQDKLMHKQLESAGKLLNADFAHMRLMEAKNAVMQQGIHKKNKEMDSSQYRDKSTFDWRGKQRCKQIRQLNELYKRRPKQYNKGLSVEVGVALVAVVVGTPAVMWAVAMPRPLVKPQAQSTFVVEADKGTKSSKDLAEDLRDNSEGLEGEGDEGLVEGADIENIEEMEEETKIRRITGHKWIGRGVRFLVEWDNDNITWEPFSDIENCLTVDIYLEHHTVANQSELPRKMYRFE
ncbi:hypothetical protein F5879DRAFT_926027 [Lentinula edodes]|nr:hypothetical protein F5879DRAFT_926027 [Lentinula edodes]